MHLGRECRRVDQTLAWLELQAPGRKIQNSRRAQRTGTEGEEGAPHTCDHGGSRSVAGVSREARSRSMWAGAEETGHRTYSEVFNKDRKLK